MHVAYALFWPCCRPPCSSAQYVFGPGNHTVYLHISNRLGCGGSLVAPQCFAGGNVVFKLIVSEQRGS